MIGMTLNPDKCKFRVTEVTYLGHKLTGEGVQPDQTKIEAIITTIKSVVVCKSAWVVIT